MKRLFFLLLFLPSCEKDFCWDCYVDVWHNESGTYTTSHQVYCNKTEKEIEEIIYKYEKGYFKNSMTCEKQ